MKHAGSIALRVSSPTVGASNRRVKRRSFLKRMIEALYISRRRQSRQLIRPYRHLLVEDLRSQPASTLDFNRGKRAGKMPTEIRRPSVQINEPATASDGSPLNLTPLAIVAILTLVFHVAIGVVLDRSHAGQMTPSPAPSVTAEETNCGAEPKQLEQSLPFD